MSKTENYVYSWFAVLSAEAQDELGVWAKPCRNTWDLLAEKYPQDLLRVVASNRLSPANQTFAVEALGSTGLPEADQVLRNVALDSNSSPVVKEGAFYGLCNLDTSDLTDVAVAFYESNSPGLRWIGNDYLEDKLNTNDVLDAARQRWAAGLDDRVAKMRSLFSSETQPEEPTPVVESDD